MDRTAYLGAITKRVRATRVNSLNDIAAIETRDLVTSETAKKFHEFVGSHIHPWVPPALIHNACFTNTLKILNDPHLPVRPIGLVHDSQRWQLFQAIPIDEPFTIRTQVSAFQVDDAGRVEIDVTSVVADGDDIAYVEVARYVAAKTKLPPAHLTQDVFPAGLLVDMPPAPDLRSVLGTNDAGSLNTGQAPALATRVLPANAGRTWAKISGDINPIHLSKFSARAFGYKRAIIHGAAMEAFIHAQTGVDGTQPVAGATYFRAPLLLPNTVELVALDHEDFLVGDQHVAIIEKRTGRDLIHATISARSRASAKAVRSSLAVTAPTEITLPRIQGRVTSTAVTTGMLRAAAGKDVIVQAAIANAQPHWRKEYRSAFTALTAIDAPSRGVAVANAGLAYLEQEIFTNDGTLLGEITLPKYPVPQGERITGAGVPSADLVVPYCDNELTGQTLIDQLKRWQDAGVLTPGAAKRLSHLAANPQLLDLSELKIGILGVGAEMAPLRFLLDRGATVYGVIRPSSRRRKEIIDLAASSAGTLILSPEEAGDLVKNPGATAAWLLDAGVDVVLDTLYARGARFLTASLGADTVMRLVGANRDILTAYFGTPTDAYLCEGMTNEPANKLQLPLRRRKPAIVNGVFNGLLELQGPNYVAAKRIGRWRATQRWAQGKGISYNVAPMTKTHSVLNSRTLRVAYAGMEKMGIHAFDVDTATTVMGALLIADIHDWRQGTQPSADFLVRNGVSSGIWTAPEEPNTLMTKAVLLGSGQYMRRLGRL
ncbi:MAG: hypothetical protein GX483_00245 [Actinomycetaceae bacterium]|nr:hypothetical protein [Actinomycetaceae bacterium]